MEPLKVRIGNLEIEVSSLEQLDELVGRYGGSANPHAGTGERKPTHHNPHHAMPHGSPQDMVLLRRLINAASTGIEASAVGDLLGKKGKGIRPAMRAWSKRIQLSTDGGDDAFEPKRVGTKRGFRLRTNFLEVAKQLEK